MAEISSFLSDVASSAPAPGGGSCSAIALAQAAALISKVMSLSMKDASEKQKENYAESLKTLERLRGLLIRLADKDSQIFLDLIAAFRLPKILLKKSRRDELKFALSTLKPLHRLST